LVDISDRKEEKNEGSEENRERERERDCERKRVGTEGNWKQKVDLSQYNLVT